jgi:hypothetical protein
MSSVGDKKTLEGRKERKKERGIPKAQTGFCGDIWVTIISNLVRLTIHFSWFYPVPRAECRNSALK